MHTYIKNLCKKFTLLPSASFFLALFCDNVGERLLKIKIHTARTLNNHVHNIIKD